MTFILQRKRQTTAQMSNYNISKDRLRLYIKIGMGILVIVAVVMIVCNCISGREKTEERAGVVIDASEPMIDVQLLTVNPFSRPGIESDGIKGIVIHYTANPGATAQENRDYFEGLKDSQTTSASSNFVIGLDGEIIQCVPTWEVAYASNDRNSDTISIECCHPDETGEFTIDTYNSMIQLTAWLCEQYDLSADDVIRHYDVTGKNCPKYFVENEEEWTRFKDYVQEAIDKEKE